MRLDAVPTTRKRILPLRALFLREANHQVRYDACHERGWADPWLLTADGRAVGYGALKGEDPRGRERDTVFECYVTPPFRRHASALFARLLDTSGAARVECQSNDALLSALLYEVARDVAADTVLFEYHESPGLAVPGATFRARGKRETVFEHAAEPAGDWVVELGGEVVATGGFLLHYNPPFADLYMEVAPAYRRRGIGGFLVQEVARECWLAGRVPAARCDIRNVASRATLTRAGLHVCGYMLAGRVARGA